MCEKAIDQSKSWLYLSFILSFASVRAKACVPAHVAVLAYGVRQEATLSCRAVIAQTSRTPYTGQQTFVWVRVIVCTKLHITAQSDAVILLVVIVFFLLLSRLRPMGLNVLGFPSHLLQRCHHCHPVTVNACGHEGSLNLSPVSMLFILSLAFPRGFSDSCYEYVCSSHY